MNIIKQESKGTGEGSSNLHVGVGKFEVVAINPNLSELQKLLGTDKITDEPNYLSETKDKEDRVSIVIWIKNDTIGLKRYQINIVDKVKVWEKSGKTVFLSQFGDTRVVACEEDLPESFTTLQEWNKDEKKFVQAKGEDGKPIKLQYRKCLQGEDELMGFMRNWINGNYKDPDCTIFVDTKKLFRSKFNELQELVGSENVQEVVLPLYVSRVDKEDGPKYYQNIGESAPLYMWPKINICLQNQSWNASKDTKKIYDKWCGENYSIVSGQGNAFKPVPLQVYDASQFLNHTSETIQHSDDTNTAPGLDY